MSETLTIEHLYQQVKFSSYSEYLAEAVRCFNAEAYRASIIMTSNAVFHTLRDYIKELAGHDLADAARVLAAMNEAENTGKTFEGVLENTLKNVSAFLPDDQLALREIRDKRNSAAHPSGYSGSRDDAYAVFKKAVVHFLAARPLVPKIAVQKLLSDLESKNFFSNNMIDDVARTVEDAMATIHPSTHYELLTKLRDRARDEVGNEDSNAEAFLCGIARLELSDLNQKIHSVFFNKREGFDHVEDALLVDLCSSWPRFLLLTAGEQRRRLDAMFARFCLEADLLPDAELIRSPQHLLQALEIQFGFPSALEAYPATVEAIVATFCHHPDFRYLATTPIQARYVEVLAARLGSGSGTADGVVALLTSHKQYFEKHLAPLSAKRLFDALPVQIAG